MHIKHLVAQLTVLICNRLALDALIRLVKGIDKLQLMHEDKAVNLKWWKR